jgi:hypothetical protein
VGGGAQPNRVRSAPLAFHKAPTNTVHLRPSHARLSAAAAHRGTSTCGWCKNENGEWLKVCNQQPNPPADKKCQIQLRCACDSFKCACEIGSAPCPTSLHRFVGASPLDSGSSTRSAYPRGFTLSRRSSSWARRLQCSPHSSCGRGCATEAAPLQRRLRRQERLWRPRSISTLRQPSRRGPSRHGGMSPLHWAQTKSPQLQLKPGLPLLPLMLPRQQRRHQQVPRPCTRVRRD